MRFNERGPLALLLALASFAASAAPSDYLPPWNEPPAGGVHFQVPPVDAVSDLYGDITDPQLVIFLGGNQFMLVPELLAAFQREHPQYQRIFVETLPPGILARQIQTGSLVMDNLRISLQPDVYTAGRNSIAELQRQHDWFAATADYLGNRLAILVAKGNPKHIRSLTDLGRADVRVSMPNPEFEGIGRQLEDCYRKAGGAALDERIMRAKLRDGSTFLTQIHHRESPLRLLSGASDAAPVWDTEAYYQQQILHHPLETVPIPPEYNVTTTSTAASLRRAPHPQAAQDFLRFLQSPAARTIYRKYGFQPIP